ncbi:hypothetical protein BDN70DRAFT_838244 [Pholiota conissans]|uniref:F-box domain-containing protein n=1 Tax=Pholiota conissans TaxID=109636 RepID=A0A9P5YYQ5_9AGAR|nr:hypothetical protein BDN70DRAFT_838244 [Pholiota conissans]
MALLFDSPFSEHARTNYIPSSIEKAHIAQLLATPQRQLRILDAEVDELQREVDKIQASKAALDEVIEEHRRLLTPFRRLPDDVLCSIFAYCLPPQGNAVMALCEAPLLLTRICSRWRRVALETPYLWRSLHVAQIPSPSIYDPPTPLIETDAVDPLRPTLRAKIQAHMFAIHQWLGRAGTYPLSISIHEWINNFEAYLPVLFSFSTRWFSIRLTVYDEATSSALACLSPSAVPLLEELHVTFSNWGSVQSHLQWERHGGILNAPKLRFVSIHHFPLDLSVIPILDWSRLTNLVLCDTGTTARRSSPSEAHMILSRCTRLVHLTLMVYDTSPGLWAPGYPSPTANFELPFLESLSLNDHYYFMATLLQGINLPSLSRVAYSTQYWPSTQRPSPLAALLFRNGGTVRHLTFDPRNLTYADLVNCFVFAPSLTHFTCRPSAIAPTHEQLVGRTTPVMVNIMRVVLRLLTPASDGECYWPRMQSIACNGPIGVDEESVLHFIHSRMKAAFSPSSSALEVLPLKEASIGFGFMRKMDLSTLLEEYTSAGLLKLELQDYWDIKEDAVATRGTFQPWSGVQTHLRASFVQPPF